MITDRPIFLVPTYQQSFTTSQTAIFGGALKSDNVCWFSAVFQNTEGNLLHNFFVRRLSNVNSIHIHAMYLSLH